MKSVSPLARTVLGFLGIVLLVVIVILWLGSGAAREVKAVYRQMLEAARRHDPDGVIRHLSRDFRYQGRGYRDAVQEVRSWVRKGRYMELEVTAGPRVQVFGERARLEVAILARTDEFPYPLRIQVRLHFRKEPGGKWLVVGAEVEQNGLNR